MSTYLEERLEWYDHNYRMGTPLITDAQFDKLEANLYRVNPEANYFSKKTILPLPSLAKNETKEFIIEGLNKYHGIFMLSYVVPFCNSILFMVPLNILIYNILEYYYGIIFNVIS